jgi:hypothetical protein
MNPMSFNFYNCFLKIRDSIGIPTPIVGVHLGVCGLIPSHAFAFYDNVNVTLVLQFQFAPFHAFALAMSPKLRS